MLNVSELCLLPDASLYAIRGDNGDEFLDLITENMSDIVFQPWPWTLEDLDNRNHLKLLLILL